ncbi:hypothetical protein EK0264_10915 [Epidermidibacterium keratini]|uniref:Uncharacterized protein n=1 Tax=Epidermidibacterium keratini TaxID=1891644 RepID=A0A7L4YPL8_9ACTN|nr:hypothetical protein [Epidermidibacterium keratini]QHC00749.1 hypothetical protein EK0264_10915 [Epidermidibacterium keratini]
MNSSARGVLVLFGFGAFLLLTGMGFVLTDRGNVTTILGWILAVLGVVLLAMAIIAYVEISRWNKQRRAGWQPLETRVAIDVASGEQKKTLLDTVDGQWRIALIGYPLELRDRVEQDGRIEYIGQIRHKKPLVVRPVGAESAEYLGYARSRDALGERPGAA